MELKFLTEKRAEIRENMHAILGAAKSEKRALTEEEIKNFGDFKRSIDEIDATIKAEESLREEDLEVAEKKAVNESAEGEKIAEERAFADYIRGSKVERANMTLGDNGAVIPTTIANRIIETVKDICPIYSLAEIFNVRGDLVIPYYGDNSGENITCAYATEFTDLTSTSGKFTSVNLSSYLAGALTKISKSLINKSDFDIVNFVTRKMAEAIAEFLENELLNGTGNNACQGILTGATTTITTGTAGAIKGDDLIDLQESVIDLYQKNAVFIMNRATRTAIRKLKDSNGDYMLNRDLSAMWGYTLLGKPVYTSDNMPTVAGDAKAIIYGDMTGLSVKLTKGVELQILNELYAAQHALGIVGWVEIDAKVTNQQKISVLKVA